MSNAQRTVEKRVPPASDADTSTSVNVKQPPLSERLPGMSDYKLNAYKASTDRIGQDPAHPKHDAARRAIPMIAAEILRRAGAPAARLKAAE